MPKVVNSRLVDAVAVKTNIYMPIVEAIANSIDAIEEREAKDGEIRVELHRNPQLIKTGEDGIAPVSSIVITDNGIGFTEENVNSFDELFSEKKLKRRFTELSSTMGSVLPSLTSNRSSGKRSRQISTQCGARSMPR